MGVDVPTQAEFSAKATVADDSPVLTPQHDQDPHRGEEASQRTTTQQMIQPAPPLRTPKEAPSPKQFATTCAAEESSFPQNEFGIIGHRHVCEGTSSY